MFPEPEQVATQQTGKIKHFFSTDFVYISNLHFSYFSSFTANGLTHPATGRHL
jgi:hypothetical protein